MAECNSFSDKVNVKAYFFLHILICLVSTVISLLMTRLMNVTLQSSLLLALVCSVVICNEFVVRIKEGTSAAQVAAQHGFVVQRKVSKRELSTRKSLLF